MRQIHVTTRRAWRRWLTENHDREKLIREGRMTGFGQAKVDVAKRSGHWEDDQRPVIPLEVPPALSEALARNPSAKTFFEGLAPSYRKQFIGWIATAKREETKAKRLKESMTLLASGHRLGIR